MHRRRDIKTPLEGEAHLSWGLRAAAPRGRATPRAPHRTPDKPHATYSRRAPRARLLSHPGAARGERWRLISRTPRQATRDGVALASQHIVLLLRTCDLCPFPLQSTSTTAHTLAHQRERCACSTQIRSRERPPNQSLTTLRSRSRSALTVHAAQSKMHAWPPQRPAIVPYMPLPSADVQMPLP